MAHLGTGAAAAAIWLANWYAPVPTWFGTLLALLAIGALFEECSDLTFPGNCSDRRRRGGQTQRSATHQILIPYDHENSNPGHHS